MQAAASRIHVALTNEAKGENPDPVLVAGLTYTVAMLNALSTELVLKALCTQESGDEPEFTHDLHKLFSKLTSETRNRLESRFQIVNTAMGSSEGSKKSIEDVFREHKDDFVEWRYTYEEPYRPVTFLDIKWAFAAVYFECLSKNE